MKSWTCFSYEIEINLYSCILPCAQTSMKRSQYISRTCFWQELFWKWESPLQITPSSSRECEMSFGTLLPMEPQPPTVKFHATGQFIISFIQSWIFPERWCLPCWSTEALPANFQFWQKLCLELDEGEGAINFRKRRWQVYIASIYWESNYTGLLLQFTFENWKRTFLSSSRRGID